MNIHNMKSLHIHCQHCLLIIGRADECLSYFWNHNHMKMVPLCMCVLCLLEATQLDSPALLLLVMLRYSG